MPEAATLDRVDLRTQLKPLFAARREPALVDVPELNYIMVDGVGAPDEGADAPATDFQQAIATLYPVAYTLKFALKRDGIESKVMPLEALWWTGEGSILAPTLPPAEWAWRALLAVPHEVTQERFDSAVAEVLRKRTPPAIEHLRFERWREGRCAQVLHLGPYSEERPTIERLHAFIAGQGLVPTGAHHEIYMGDPRNAAPEKLKTILRQPVRQR